MYQRWISVAATGLVSLTFAPSLASADESWRIKFSEAECLRQNAGLYLDQEDDPIVIVVGACPVVDLEEALSKLAQNNAVSPTVVLAGDEVLVLNRSELVCLGKIEFKQDVDGLVTIPKALTCE